MVNECALSGRKMSANHGEIFPHRSMSEKLSDECVAVGLSLSKKQKPGGKAVNAMHDEGSLFSAPQFSRKQRPRGRGVGVWHGNGGKSGRFIEGHHGIVFVNNGQFG
jgi:hypothetical protein